MPRAQRGLDCDRRIDGPDRLANTWVEWGYQDDYGDQQWAHTTGVDSACDLELPEVCTYSAYSDPGGYLFAHGGTAVRISGSTSTLSGLSINKTPVEFSAAEASGRVKDLNRICVPTKCR